MLMIGMIQADAQSYDFTTEYDTDHVALEKVTYDTIGSTTRKSNSSWIWNLVESSNDLILTRGSSFTQQNPPAGFGLRIDLFHFSNNGELSMGNNGGQHNADLQIGMSEFDVLNSSGNSILINADFTDRSAYLAHATDESDNLVEAQFESSGDLGRVIIGSTYPTWKFE